MGNIRSVQPPGRVQGQTGEGRLRRLCLSILGNEAYIAMAPRHSMVTRSHLMELPKKILIGEDVLKEIGNFIEVPKAARVTVASGTNVQEKVREVVASSLHGSVVWVDVERSDSKNVRSVMKASSRAHCIIGLGGGKSVDVGKLAASKLGVPFYSVPTSASHDGIASPFASVNDSKRHYSIKAKPPVGILADVDVIAAAPSRLFAAGCGDLVSKLTAVRDWQLGHDTKGEYYGGYAASLALMSASVVLDNPAKMGKRGRASGEGPRRGADQRWGGSGHRWEQQALQRFGAHVQSRAGRSCSRKGTSRGAVRNWDDNDGEAAGSRVERGQDRPQAGRCPHQSLRAIPDRGRCGRRARRGGGHKARQVHDSFQGQVGQGSRPSACRRDRRYLGGRLRGFGR